eukprot:scaffold4641_cov76-Amphora_coffeaeformis.AAC.1
MKPTTRNGSKTPPCVSKRLGPRFFFRRSEVVPLRAILEDHEKRLCRSRFAKNIVWYGMVRWGSCSYACFVVMM